MKKNNTLKIEWKEWENMHKSLSILQQQQIKAGASFSLSKKKKSSKAGIHSSDINFSLFNIWKNVGKDIKAYIEEGINLYAQRLEEVIRW